MATVAANNPAQRVLDAWNSLSVSVRISLALVVAGAIVAAALATTSVQATTDRAVTPLMGGFEFSLESRESAIKAFQEAKLTDYSFSGGKILVPREKQNDYLAALASSKSGLPGSTDDAIDRYIEEQRSWWASTAESERLFRVAEERRLARVIETFPEIDHASVLVSEPPQRGTLRHRTPQGTAAVKVTTRDGKPLHPRRIDQIRQLVAGKFRDIPGPEKVEVVSDAISGTTVGSPDGAELSDGSNQYLMTKAAFAQQVENKIRELFADLKGLIVTVNAELDPRHARSQRIDTTEKGPVRRETSDTSISESATPAPAPGGEPGVRTNVDAPGVAPNQGAVVAGAGGNPNSQNDEATEKEYENGTTLTDQSFVDYEPIKIGVVVRYRTPPAKEGETAPATTAAGPDPVQIRQMIASLGYPGVTVDTVSVQPYEGEEPEVVEDLGPSMFAAMAQHIPSVALGLVGLAAIAVAFAIARRAPVPQLARLAETAVESQTVHRTGGDSKPDDSHRDESVVKFERTQEQLNKMVKDNPEAAASLVRRWIVEFE